MTRLIDTFDYYETLAMRTAHYLTDGPEAMLYCGCALAGKAGGVANELRKAVMEGGALSDARRRVLIDQIGDVLWYLNSLAVEIDTSLEECATRNIEKLEQEYREELDAIRRYECGQTGQDDPTCSRRP